MFVLRSTQNTLCGQNVELLNVKLAVQIVTTGLYRIKTLILTSLLIVCMEITAVCFHIFIKHTNTLCGQNLELLNVNPLVHILTTVM
jgi:hypothetical protein